VAKLARLLAAVFFSLQIAGLAGVLGGFFWTPGWMVVHYVIRPEGMGGLGLGMAVGFGVDFVLVCAMLYGLFGWVEIKLRNR
jgi:hypothetical protein